MKEEIHPQMYVPHWDPIYCNLNNNSRQNSTTFTIRKESDPDLVQLEQGYHRSKTHTNSPTQNNSHESIVDNIETTGDSRDGLSEINYTLIRENIEKRKRIRILKQVQTVMDKMFTRVLDMTDGLKIQVDEALKEHRRANKMFGKLQCHLTGIQDSLRNRAENDTFTDIELETVRARLTPPKVVLPKIEKIQSANSSRPCSFPYAFKGESPVQSPGGECFSTSKTSNIRKIAVKKSREKSIMEMKGDQTETCLPENVHKASERRNCYLKTNSADLKHPKESKKGKAKERSRKSSDLTESLLESHSRMKNSCAGEEKYVRDKPSSNELLKGNTRRKMVPNEISIDSNPSKVSVLQRSTMLPQTVEITTTKSRNEKISAVLRQRTASDQKYTDEKHDCGVAKIKRLPKLNIEQIVEKIKSIEDCIIQPNKQRKECENSVTAVRDNSMKIKNQLKTKEHL